MYNCPTIESYKIIRIVNAAWSKSFARIESNKKAIAERDWYLYSHALMLHLEVRTSITDMEEEE